MISNLDGFKIHRIRIDPVFVNGEATYAEDISAYGTYVYHVSICGAATLSKFAVSITGGSGSGFAVSITCVNGAINGTGNPLSMMIFLK